MDELEILNATRNGDRLKALGDDLKEHVAWKKKYAKWPKIICGRFVWRRHYWVRKTLDSHYDKVYAFKEPKLEGYFYIVWEQLHDDHLANHIKHGVLKVK